MFPFALLCGYWLIFLGYTLFNFVEGGPRAVAGWYWHISTEGCWECITKPWSLQTFLLKQLLLAVITALLWFFVRRKVIMQEKLA